MSFFTDPPPWLPRALLISAAVVLVGGLVGVPLAGDDDDGPAAVVLETPADLQAATDATTATGSARLAMTVAVTGPLNLDGTIDGEMEFATGNARTTIALAGVSVEARLVDGLVYILGSTNQAIAAPSPWIRIDPAQARVEGLEASYAAGLDLLAGLAGPGATQVTAQEEQQVRGVATTRYVVAVDPAAAGSLAGQLAGSAESATVDTLEVYVDRQGLIRRVVVAVTTTSAGAASTIAVNAEFYDFGAPVTVVAPPPEEFTDVTGQLTPPPPG